MLGEVRLFAGNFAPDGWARCDGTTLSVEANTELFAVLGTTYGGDGRTNFSLPHLDPPSGGEPGTFYIIATSGSFPTRA